MTSPRWQARSLPLSSSQVLIVIALGTPLLFALGVLTSSRHPAAFGIVALLAIGGAVVAARTRRAARSVTEIAFEGDALVLYKDGVARRHPLTVGSLHASRSYHGTVLYVRLADDVTTVAVPALLPADRYADGRADHADLYVEAGSGGEALLERVGPYLMPRVIGATATEGQPPIFSIPLEGGTTPLSVLIAGDTLALSNRATGTLIARARAADIDVKVSSYHRGADDVVLYHPCLRLRFPDRAEELSVGTVLFEGDDAWEAATLQRGDAPVYQVTPAELRHLATALGLRAHAG